MTADNDGPAPSPATLVVFGRDDAGKPHASAFDDTDAELAEKAAGLMGMTILRLTTDEQRGLAGKLPKGRVFASGKAFVPFVNKTLYEQLVAASGGEAGAQKAPTRSEPTSVASPEPSNNVQPQDPSQPDWTVIAVGSVVLATENPKEGWYEAVVKAVKGDLYTLAWRDWPGEAAFVRKGQHLAVLRTAKAA